VQAVHTTQTSQHSLPPLQALLNADGSLDLTTGFAGTLDPAGWRLEVAPDGAPVLRSVGSPVGPKASSNTWHALGPGLGENVNAIAVAGPDVYVGGIFSSAGGDPDADRVARWDGASWHALGPGLNGSVYAIAVAGPDVYVGGYFTNAGGNPNAPGISNAGYIASWDGSSWHALGPGLNGWVRAIVMSGPNVNVGGDFTNAGGNADADCVARWGTVFSYVYLPVVLR
jgi:hypothetical protein